MSQELFGPICPVIKATTVEAQTSIAGSGGVTVNDCLMHAAIGGAPFGGVGESGHGYYHGVHGFLTFTHTRAVMAPPTWLDRFLSPRYPPYALPRFLQPLETAKVPFKRGETLEDQWRNKNTKLVSAAKLLAPGVVLSAAFLSFGSLRSRFG
ncbi:hypothetical protein FOPE_04094 [Fonsecaea pedrosoi]|nr:hypothetical protein FOPE_04094 [Fonsecaea pedrosoi]